MSKEKKEVVAKERAFYITSVCKADLIEYFGAKLRKNPNYKKHMDKIEALNAAEMEHLAQKMANDYIEQMFWPSLEYFFEDIFMSEK